MPFSQLSTFADSASLHLSIDFVLFFLEVEKKTLLVVNKVRYSPFSYRILAAQMKAAIQVSLVQGRDIDFPRKKAKRRHMYQSNGFLSVNDSCNTKDTVSPYWNTFHLAITKLKQKFRKNIQ